MSESEQMPAKTPVVLTIAGFDPSSGAGITADLQVFAAHGLFGIAAITALTVQSTLGVAAVHPVDEDILRKTLDHLVADIQPAGIKIGMLGSAGVVRAVVDFVRTLSDVVRIPVVLDPVICSSSGAVLLEADALDLLRNELIPLVTWITPNTMELNEIVCERSSDTLRALSRFGERFPDVQVLATGGDLDGSPIDTWRSPDGMVTSFHGERVATQSTHGTGCALSSALLSRLVQGWEPAACITSAKSYVEGALRRAPGVGHGAGPLNLLWPLRGC